MLGCEGPQPDGFEKQSRATSENSLGRRCRRVGRRWSLEPKYVGDVAHLQRIPPLLLVEGQAGSSDGAGERFEEKRPSRSSFRSPTGRQSGETVFRWAHLYLQEDRSQGFGIREGSGFRSGTEKTRDVL